MRTARKRLGAHLRESRQARSLSRADVARSTCIPIRTLALLENGEFDELPADVFVRGFLRSYADHVGLDPGDTICAYESCRGARSRSPDLAPAAHLSDAPAGVRVRTSRKAGTLTAGRAVVALIVAAAVAFGTLAILHLVGA